MNIDFTEGAWEVFRNTVTSESFADMDSEEIFNSLKDSLQLVPFGNYLKRYIFKKAGFEEEDFSLVPLEEYRDSIRLAFRESNTPASFSPTQARLGTLAKNWLTQQTVNRKVVFLLGFGLQMSVEDVSTFLTHALCERDFNFKDPFEVICYYCFRKHLPFFKYEELMERYEKLPSNGFQIDFSASGELRILFMNVETEDELIHELLRLKHENRGKLFSYTAKQAFDRLYQDVKTIIAKTYTNDEQEKAKERADDFFYNDRIQPYLTTIERYQRANEIRNGYKKYDQTDISASDAEQFLCCGVPFQKGNLQRIKDSSLAEHFRNKRMSRQHITGILNEETGVDRFDLLTLNFFIYAMQEDYAEKKKELFSEIIDKSNLILRDCGLSGVYITNPYECFLLMCLSTDYPMGAYSDVIEMSYDEVD